MSLSDLLNYRVSEAEGGDPYALAPLPPDGTHSFKWACSEAVIKAFYKADGKTKVTTEAELGDLITSMGLEPLAALEKLEVRFWLSANLIGECVAPGLPYDGAKVYHEVTSLTRREEVSELGFLLRSLGVWQPELTMTQLRELVVQTFPERTAESTVAIQASGAWLSQFKDKDGKYKTLYRGMRRHPLDADKNPMRKFDGPNGEPVIAKWSVEQFVFA